MYADLGRVESAGRVELSWGVSLVNQSQYRDAIPHLMIALKKANETDRFEASFAVCLCHWGMRGPEAIEKDLNRLLATSRRPFDRERLEHTLVVVEREIGRWLEATEHLLRARRIANDLGVSASAQGATATELALVAYERSDKTEGVWLFWRDVPADRWLAAVE